MRCKSDRNAPKIGEIMRSGRGVKPLPTAIKKLRGNPGKRPLNDLEPKPDKINKIITPDEYLGSHSDILSESSREAFNMIADDLKNAGVLTKLDYMSLMSLCLHLGDWLENRRLIIKHSRYAKTEAGGVKMSVFYRQASQSWDQAMRIMSCFGMTPSDRTRIKVNLEVGEKEEDDDLYHPKLKVVSGGKSK